MNPDMNDFFLQFIAKQQKFREVMAEHATDYCNSTSTECIFASFTWLQTFLDIRYGDIFL